MTDFQNEYGYQYHTYPIHSMETSTEGAFKRFTAFPQPNDVFHYALLGLPKKLVLDNTGLEPEFARTYLESAINEIEMQMGCNLSEITHFHSEDYLDGKFTSNHTGIRLPKWPATQITMVQMKYPHTNNPVGGLYQVFTIPPNWVYLKKNKLNVVPSVGAQSIMTANPGALTAFGAFANVVGIGRGPWQPGIIEVTYKAGFNSDRIPAVMADLIKTWAARRMLIDLIAVMFPNGGVSVSIDSVSQSVTYNVQQLLTNKVEMLGQKQKELAAAIKKSHGRSVVMSFIGA